MTSDYTGPLARMAPYCSWLKTRCLYLASQTCLIHPAYLLSFLSHSSHLVPLPSDALRLSLEDVISSVWISFFFPFPHLALVMVIPLIAHLHRALNYRLDAMLSALRGVSPLILKAILAGRCYDYHCHPYLWIRKLGFREETRI